MKQIMPALWCSFFVFGSILLYAQGNGTITVYTNLCEDVKWVYNPDFDLFALASNQDSLLTGFDFKRPAPFRDGVAVVEKSGSFEFLRTNGVLTDYGNTFLLPGEGSCYAGQNSYYTMDGIELDDYFESTNQFNDNMLSTLRTNHYTDCRMENGFLIFGTADHKKGVIDKFGNLIIPPLYHSIGIKKGHFWVYLDKKYGIFNLSGQILMPPTYLFIGDYAYQEVDRETNISIRIDSSWGNYNLSIGKEIPCRYEAIYAFKNGKAWAVREGNYILLDSLGNETVVAEQERCVILEDTLLVVEKGGIKVVKTLENKTIKVDSASFSRKEGAAFIFTRTVDRALLLVDFQGKLIKNTGYLEVIGIGENHFLIRDSFFCYGLLRSDGYEVQPPYFNHYFIESDRDANFLLALNQIPFSPSHESYTAPKKYSDNPTQYDWTTYFYSISGNLVAKTNLPYSDVDLEGNGLISYSLDTGYIYYSNGRIISNNDEKIHYSYRTALCRRGFFAPEGHAIEDGLRGLESLILRKNVPNIECLIVSKEKSGVGLLNRMGKMVIPPIYEKIIRLSDTIFAIKEKRNWGLVNSAGKILCSPAFDTIHYPLFDIYIVRKHGKWGALDRHGFMFLEPSFDWIKPYQDGQILLKDEKGYYFYTNESPTIESPTIQPSPCFEVFDMLQLLIPSRHGIRDKYIIEGLAPVKKEHKYGFVDSTDQLIIPLIYDDVASFGNGQAKVKKDKKWGMIDKEGNIILPCEYHDINTSHFKCRGFSIIEHEGKYGLFQDAKNVLHPCIYDKIRFITVGDKDFVVVYIGKLCGLINQHGKLICPPKYESIEPFENKWLTVILNQKRGLMDILGKELIPPIYQKYNYNSYRNVFIVKSDNLFGVIDSNYQVVVEPKYDHIDHYLIVQKNNLLGLLNTHFDEMLSCSYQSIEFVGKYHYKVFKNDKRGLVNTETGMFIPTIQFEDINVFPDSESGYYYVKKGKKWGAVDRKGEIKIPLRFEAISPFQNGVAHAIIEPFTLQNWYYKGDTSISPVAYYQTYPIDYLINMKGEIVKPVH